MCSTWLSMPHLFRSGKNLQFTSSVTFLFPVPFLLPFSLAFICHRGWQGLIAQGCHSSILIIDPKTSQTIQVLERHKANVVKVSFLSI